MNKSKPKLIRSLSKELQITAVKELNEIPAQVSADIEDIREWITQQPHLNARTDDQWLLNFLRVCQFNRQQTKEKIEFLYTVRSLVPELFINRDPFLPEIQEVLSQGMILPLNSSDDGPRAMLFRYESMKPEIPFEIILKTALMFIDILMWEDDNAIIAGQQLFIDMNGASIDYFFTTHAVLSKKFEVILANAYSPKPTKINFINASENFENIYKIMESFISDKYRSMIHIAVKGSGANQGAECPLLPKEYGGEGNSIAELTAYWKNKLESYKNWFVDDEKYHSNESKRQGQPKTCDGIFS